MKKILKRKQTKDKTSPISGTLVISISVYEGHVVIDDHSLEDIRHLLRSVWAKCGLAQEVESDSYCG